MKTFNNFIKSSYGWASAVYLEGDEMNGKECNLNWRDHLTLEDETRVLQSGHFKTFSNGWEEC